MVHFFQTEGEMLLRLLLSVVLGGLIGTERSRRQKEAGIRTHVIVALGATLVMLVSRYGFLDMLAIEGIDIDPTRIASNIVTGVSFLGAGVIFVKNASIHGLTTAAGVWATAAVGMAIGSGLYAVGLFATMLIVVLQFLLHSTLNRVEVTAVQQLELRVRYSPKITERLREQLAEHQMVIESFKMKKSADDIVTCTLMVRMPRDIGYDELLFLLDDNEDIVGMNV
ncbi:MAG: MgtC/SapB family protein [Clostridia bacterium]|nr:MgtC/SapB family protein [Clostridia bacterium]